MKPTNPRAVRDSDAYLRRLGEHVRTLRNQRGMSRKALAQHARVSERYLAQLEVGKGNCSIVLLRHFGEPTEDLRRRRIALIGLRGGGKSTLGRLLAEKLDVPFIELDREIERRSGASLSEIFEMFGQETFRRAEHEALESVLHQHRHFVMATSGSIVTDPGAMELLLSSCFTVWVRAEPEDHMRRVVEQGDMRPMANSARAMEDLIAILKSREPLYAKAETVLVTTGKTPEQNLSELMRVIPAPDTQIARQPA
jgi:XRE family aerobic/anaerobic benzoate catabolism transcriptional regulator